MTSIPREELMNTHELMFEMMEALGIRTILYDDDKHEVTIFYMHENMEPLTVTNAYMFPIDRTKRYEPSVSSSSESQERQAEGNSY
jgi:hypothetical protein